MLRIISSIYDAAITPSRWPAALQLMAEGYHASGASCRIWNRETGQVEWLALSTNYPIEASAVYLDYYAALDLYLPVLADAARDEWAQLLETVAPDVLRSSEWYHDFVVRYAHILDIWGTRLLDDGPRTVIFTVHQGIAQNPIRPAHLPALRSLPTALAQAVQLNIELGRMRGSSVAALLATEQLGAAVIVVDRNARIVEANPVAEQLLRVEDGLTGRGGQLGARRNFETARLASLIRAANDGSHGERVGGRMLIGGREAGDLPLIASVTPLPAECAPLERPLAMVLVVGAGRKTGSTQEVAELFGLSPAESRVALGIAAGGRPAQIAADLGVKITTVRSQISAILKKLQIERQSDLVRLLSDVPVRRPGRRPARPEQLPGA